MMTVDKIKELIGSIHGVSLIEDFIIDEAGSLKGRITVVTDLEHADLEWYVEISPTYPFKIMGMEPIRFQNKNLLVIHTLCRAVTFACTLRNMIMQRVSL